ncbi:hypothetical protein OHS33_37450 (plasmid) [Streptomyces sp. NBC_00536]|uniref:hypothetical protein n=1 Tax=Streptomyces sp. NBC_00536 TaxID=2975769 RepID=UPI002E804470|nr:hypothetical protein [Streptomyces sp. NBC_00536]WUC84095.1 hypothetical protein OHS33_37450 [Streptomyces sp. NBC_00536]
MTTPHPHRRPRNARTGSRLLRKAATAATVLAGSAALLLGPASPVSATTTPGTNATPYNQGGEWWTTDGCTDVPDSGVHHAWVQYGKPPFTAYGYLAGRYDFHHACMHHDGCYKYRWADRATCDQWFRNDMHASCTAMKSNAACDARAELYYRGVRVFGEIPWKLHDIRISMNQYVA